jgi:hypothetical protein
VRIAIKTRLRIPKTSTIRQAIILMACLFFAALGRVEASTWQIMLIPDIPLHDDINLSNSTQVIADSSFVIAIREGISGELRRAMYAPIAPERVFATCEQNLCAMQSKQALLQKVANEAPEVELVLFYHLALRQNEYVLGATLIDPVSFQTYDSFTLNVLGGNLNNISGRQVKSLSKDMGRVISLRLQQSPKHNDFTLLLKGFALDEVAPFASFVLSETLDTSLQLTSSEKEASVWSRYLPTVKTQFAVTSSLTESQFNHLLLRFFQDQNIDVVNEYQQTEQAFVVTRIGSPYTPSLLNTLLFVCIAVALVILLIKRQVYHYQLEALAEKKAVTQWLDIYNRAKAPWFFLQTQWRNQGSYWQRLQRESNDLEKQASMFFEAGDHTTAKLFISKALNLNSDAVQAKTLMNKIAKQEANQKALSDKEQWVRNKVAKAMNNYRRKQPIKALRQAYQALEASAGEKKLKRQHKAIKRLIHKINIDFAQAHHQVILNDLLTGNTCLVSTSKAAEIGRASTALAHSSFSVADNTIEFPINHKALSRIGGQCRVSMHNGAFYIQDQQSKNGSFLQSKALLTLEEPLHNGDYIYLGANSEINAVKLKVDIDSGHTLLHLRIQKQLQHTLDITDLAKAWPDYVSAMRSSLALTQSHFVLAVDSHTDAIMLVSEVDAMQNRNNIVLAKIVLGTHASLIPLSSAENEHLFNNPITYNNEVLHGQVPLVLPCELKWKHQHIRIEQYSPIYNMGIAQ